MTTTRRTLGGVGVLFPILAFGFRDGGAQAPETFSVATWNIRSGYGAVAEGVHSPFDMNTANCTDATKPQNAWGVGLPQRFINADIGADPSMVALGLQEAWGSCGNVKNIAALLKWTASPERSGVGLLARYGIVGQWDMWQVEMTDVAGAPEDRWIVGANVCIARDCMRTVYMWTTHLSATVDEEWPKHVQKVLDFLANKRPPHIVTGDFNLWRNDQWSPSTACGRPTVPMSLALSAIHAAGYRDAWSAVHAGAGWTGMLGRTGCGVERGGTPYKRIDYVWSRGLEPVAATRIGVVGGGVPAPSDHMGVKAQFLVPGRRPRDDDQ